MEFGDPINADIDHPRRTRINIHASDAMLHLLQLLHVSILRKHQEIEKVLTREQ